MLPVRYFVGLREGVGQDEFVEERNSAHCGNNILVDPTTKALKIAKQVLEWASEKNNQRVFNDFEERLLSELKKMFFQA